MDKGIAATRGRLVDRLRGIYRIPITDGLGAVGGGEEPDNPDEFVRKFETSPIMHEAAGEIDRLTYIISKAKEIADDMRKNAEPGMIVPIADLDRLVLLLTPPKEANP